MPRIAAMRSSPRPLSMASTTMRRVRVGVCGACPPPATTVRAVGTRRGMGHLQGSVDGGRSEHSTVRERRNRLIPRALGPATHYERDWHRKVSARVRIPMLSLVLVLRVAVSKATSHPPITT